MMSSAYYELYLKQVFDLAGTMIIKSEDTALAINEHLRLMGVAVDLNDPRTWKYYLNLSGQYHSTDKPMYVTSIDTLEIIPFTRESLRQHRGTQREYGFHSRYYRELLDRHPDQELLIRGILNPISLEKAISSDDHTILYYDKNLVEGNETNLIEKLQEFINGFFSRWDVPDYRITDPWFVPAQLGILFALIPKAILNIRMSNCKTDYAHSYHVRQYLGSFGKLDNYFDFMTTKQRLFFYRNLHYINSNNGKQETFEWLTEKVMSDRLFPVSEYILQQNDTAIPEQLKANIEFERKSINGLEEPLGSDIKTVKTLLEIQQPKAKGNKEHLEEAIDETTRLSTISRQSKHRTKVLESSVMDLAEAEPFTLTEVLINHWIYFSNIGKYRSVFVVNNPVTNSAMLVPVRDAWLLYLYAYNKARGVTLEKIPTLVAKRVIRIPPPTRSELDALVDKRYVPEELIDEALSLYPALDTYSSIEAFREACVTIHANMLAHRDLATYQHHFLTRGQVELMVDRFYMDFKIENDLTNTEYSAWLKENNYRIDELGVEELDMLSVELFQQATGYKAKATKTLKEIHEAMCKLMEQISSYSIQIIPTINSGSLKIIDWPYLRYGDTKSWSGDKNETPVSVALPLSDEMRPKGYVFREIGERHASGYESKTSRKEVIELKLLSSYGLSSVTTYQRRLPVATVTSFEDAKVDLGLRMTGQIVDYLSTRYDIDALLKMSPLQAAVHVIGEKLNTPISPSRVDIVPVEDRPDGTLSIVVRTSDDAQSYFHNRYVGEGSVILKRLSLNTLGTPTVNVTLPTTTANIIEALSQQFGIVFDEADYVLEPVRANTHIVKAKTLSLRWMGQVTVTII